MHSPKQIFSASFSLSRIFLFLLMGSGYSTKKHKRLNMMDHGSLKPLDLYNKNDAYDLTAVRELILSKKLAPFYKGLSNPFVIPIRFNKKQKDYMLYLMNKEKKLYDKLYSNSVECPICFLVSTTTKKITFFFSYLCTN